MSSSTIVHSNNALQAIKDWMLVIIVLMVVGIDLLIHVGGTAVPAARLNATIIPDELMPKGFDVWNIIALCCVQMVLFISCNSKPSCSDSFIMVSHL